MKGRAASPTWSPPPSPPRFPALLYGLIIGGAGIAMLVAAELLRAVLLAADPQGRFLWLVLWIVWLAELPVILGIALVVFDLYVLLPRKRTRVDVQWEPLANTYLTVALTAYNDETSIGLAVQDFLSHPQVKRVIVVDNNSRDRTSEVAREAGAIVILEPHPGYGSCVVRALTEASQYSDTEASLLCEGDRTFRSYDIDKFLAYAPHADIVNGTRIVEQLRTMRTQLTTFMFYGNFFVGKLLEAKHIGLGTLTDVGTTYKLCRNSCLRRLLPLLNRDVNLEFNAYFMDQALTNGFSLVECPVTFHPRVGASKGGNINNRRALRVGLRMLFGILFSWKPLIQKRP
jgi:glycosyltransferase involved in cell wall biosynthesis